jgi:hypothetical protein
MAEAEQLFQAVALVGGTLTGVVSVIVALGKARELANKPLEVLKSDLTAQVGSVKTELDKSTSSIREGIQAVRKDVDVINVHFDPKGGDVRGKLDSIERRLTAMDASGASERAELKGLIGDLKPILYELRDRA